MVGLRWKITGKCFLDEEVFPRVGEVFPTKNNEGEADERSESDRWGISSSS